VVNIPIDVNWMMYISKIMYWVGYVLLIIVILGLFVAIYFFLQFNIKAEVYTLYGSGKDGVYSFSKPVRNRVRWINKKTAWRAIFPLFNKKDIEPFDQEYIYPGKNIKAFDFNGEWIPGRINIKQNEDTLKAEINPIPYYVRNWQSLKHKEHAQEFAEHNWWADNKYFFMVIITAGLCLVMVGVTVYFTYNYATGGLNAANGIADALRNFNTIPGVAPR